MSLDLDLWGRCLLYRNNDNLSLRTETLKGKSFPRNAPPPKFSARFDMFLSVPGRAKSQLELEKEL